MGPSVFFATLFGLAVTSIVLLSAAIGAIILVWNLGRLATVSTRSRARKLRLRGIAGGIAGSIVLGAAWMALAGWRDLRVVTLYLAFACFGWASVAAEIWDRPAELGSSPRV